MEVSSPPPNYAPASDAADSFSPAYSPGSPPPRMEGDDMSLDDRWLDSPLSLSQARLTSPPTSGLHDTPRSIDAADPETPSDSSMLDVLLTETPRETRPELPDISVPEPDISAPALSDSAKEMRRQLNLRFIATATRREAEEREVQVETEQRYRRLEMAEREEIESAFRRNDAVALASQRDEYLNGALFELAQLAAQKLFELEKQPPGNRSPARAAALEGEAAERSEAVEAGDEAHLRTLTLRTANAVIPNPATPQNNYDEASMVIADPDVAVAEGNVLTPQSDDFDIDALLTVQSTTVKAIKEHRMMKIAEKKRRDSIQEQKRRDSIQERAAHAEHVLNMYSQNLSQQRANQQTAADATDAGLQDVTRIVLASNATARDQNSTLASTLEASITALGPPLPPSN